MKHTRLVLTLVSLVFSTSLSHAAALFWDGGGTGGTTLGGSGNWDQVSPLWYNGVSDVPWSDSANSDAIFTGASGTVTLTDTIMAADIYFTNVAGDMLITNETAADTLSVPGTIDTGGGNHTIGAPLVNSSTLTKAGNGILYLTTDNSSTITSGVMVNQGSLAVTTDNGAGQYNSITVANGAAFVLDGGTNDLPAFYPSVTISGTGVTNSGALRNLSGVTTFYGQIILAQNNSMIYADSGSALVYDGESGPLTDNGNGYNVIISGNGTGNVHLGATSIGGTLIVMGSASCYAYVNGITPIAWTSTYVSNGAAFYAENNNSFGTSPAALMTTNMILDGSTLVSAGTYTMYANDGITASPRGGTLIDNSGTWTTANIYSISNAPVTLTCTGSMRPGGAAGTTLGTINLGSGMLIKTGTGDCNLGYANPSLEIYSNITVSGSGSLSFNYDSSGGVSSLGAVPSSLNPSNIIIDGGSLHVGHSTTIGATRGIFVTTNNATIEDIVSSGGTVTINSPITGPGNVNFPNGYSGKTSTVILANNDSYAATTIAASSAVTVGAGGTTGTLGTGPTTNNGTLTFNRTSAYTYAGVISGSGPLTKNNTNTLTLSGANTYTGATTVSAGTLLAANTSGSGTGTGNVTVNSGASLGGTGTIAGAVSVSSGGTLALGGSTLTLTGNLTLAGNVSVTVNKSLSPSSGMAVVSGTLANTGTGTVKVTVAGASLAPGDTFQLFSQAVSGGASLAVSGGGVTWNNNLAVNGTISVAAAAPHPVISSVSLSGGKLVISATNGAAADTFIVYSSTNVALPLSSWTPVLTNTFNSSGSVSVTNSVSGLPQQFFILQAQ